MKVCCESVRLGGDFVDEVAFRLCPRKAKVEHNLASRSTSSSSSGGRSVSGVGVTVALSQSELPGSNCFGVVALVVI